ncbi:transcriptional regulator [Actinosynnema sp. ALI-1.44]|uniref:Scr1 family TA system antitoxin-like transcriptional regulator n=1 Tax=Actinosynnema sp. ALI-1.44 TaxID=1933779 RepID=UPI00097BB2C5|nr:Scr1 family TA system antitoxin-like transcriptional regulator [Actinosynnema sp. ALI-1.44]ONI73256.1 transcriptional regulator [Actinosynnema sp. ALI-1.44]
MTPTSSTVQAWELGIRLKERREELGMTAAAAGKATGLGGTNLSAIETGKRKLPPFRMADIAEVYGLTDQEMFPLEALRAGADRREWYHDYSLIYSDEFIRFLGLESGAVGVRNYEGEVIPGLLQTADYAKAMIKGGGPYIRPVEVDVRVESRMLRQDRLVGECPLRLSAVVGEAALRQQVGGRGVMRGQLKRLAEMAVGSVDVRVMPFSAGAHPLIGNSAILLSFLSPRLPDLLWQETVTSQTIVDKRSKLLEVSASFDHAMERALSHADSMALIRRVLKELE